MCRKTCAFVIIIILKCFPIQSLFLIAPQDVPQGLAAIYGFAPIISKGNDHRLGFGFSFGNHADFQILYEFGPQTVTKPLKSNKVRSVSIRQRYVRRRPVLEFLIRAGFFKEPDYHLFTEIDETDDEPR